MKALVLHGVNDLSYEDVDEPELTKDAVLVKVKAAGICGSDIPRIYRKGTYHFPTIPGHEFSGEVVKVCNGADAKLQGWLGKRVGIFPLIPCGSCGPCRKKQYEMCQHYSYLGSREDGGFAEYVKVPVWNLIQLPDAVTYEQAAMLEPMSVAVHAIRNSFSRRIGPVDQSAWITVCGLGTIGTFLVMFLHQMGYENLIGIGNKDFQKRAFLEMTQGRGTYIDSRIYEDLPGKIQEITGFGTELYFECVGRPETVSLGFNAAAPGGSVQLVGNPISDMLLFQDAYWQILRRQLVVTGTWNSSFRHGDDDDWHYVLTALDKGRIHPEKLITHRFSMEDLPKGLELMRDKTEPYIKVMGIFG